VDLGVFLPITNNGWICSKTSPQFKPTFDLNKRVTLIAESLGFEFVFSMVRWRGYGGETEHWDHSLDSISLMAGLAAVTETIDLYATVHPTTLNPAVAAKMFTTLDDISGGRAGLNIASGWDKVELDSFGVWPGDEHYSERYDLAEEWLHIVKTLWEHGRCSFAGKYFRMNDVVSLPTPRRRIPVVNAGMSPRGLEVSAKFADTSFVVVPDEDLARQFASSLREQTQTDSNSAGMKMTALFTIVAAKTDEEAQSIVEHIRAGADADAIAELVRRTSGASVTSDALAKMILEKRRAFHCPLLVGSPESIAEQMRGFEASGVTGFLLTFPDFIADLEFFGEEVLPLLERDRAPV